MDLKSKTETVIKSLLISSPRSLTISDLDSEFLKSEGYAIPFDSLGYAHLKEFLLSIPDILTISYSGDIIPVATNGRSYHIHKFVASNASTSFNRFNDTYRYPRSHPRIKIGYSSRDFNLDHESSNEMSRVDVRPRLVKAADFTGGDQGPIDRPPIGWTDVPPIVVPKQVEIEELNKTRHAADEALPFIDQDDPIHFLGLGLTSSNVGVKIPSPALTEFKSGHSYHVFVTEINRLSSFWFVLCSSRTEYILMEEQLRLHDNKATMKSFEMVPGIACLVAHKEKVLRAEFLEKPVNGKVTVCFVDYGTVDVVHISQCHRINKYFALIPKLCFPGALELGLMPSGRESESALIQRFCKMVEDKPLCGYVTRVDRKNMLVRMVLVDTSDATEDLIVNRELLTG
ncbi:uncharacterized protein LOC119083690 [Bradysia coprophila]|uniref:uncharacterized protein LOC119083690 n=1 Tax=Bradysia coprophila TaxID=38358 RepID=UPI00187DAA8B|nr:uncharacterized protein LOC119083690 [Bradysia coprophila]